MFAWIAKLTAAILETVDEIDSISCSSKCAPTGPIIADSGLSHSVGVVVLPDEAATAS